MHQSCVRHSNVDDDDDGSGWIKAESPLHINEVGDMWWSARLWSRRDAATVMKTKLVNIHHRFYLFITNITLDAFVIDKTDQFETSSPPSSSRLKLQRSHTTTTNNMLCIDCCKLIKRAPLDRNINNNKIKTLQNTKQKIIRCRYEICQRNTGGVVFIIIIVVVSLQSLACILITNQLRVTTTTWSPLTSVCVLCNQ